MKPIKHGKITGLIIAIAFTFFFCCIQSSPRISIITSIYKGDQFIKGFLENITSQIGFDQAELILINANSPGNEEPLIKNYMQKYSNIIYKKLKKDPGLYGVWNEAIKLSSAPYITNANLDDRRFLNSLISHIQVLDKNLHIDLVYSDFYYVNKPNSTENNYLQTGVASNPEFALKHMHICLPGPHPTWRKRLHEKAGFFNEDYKAYGDWEMWLRAVSRGCIFKKIPGVTCLYYLNPLGLSTNVKTKEERTVEFHRIQDFYSYLWQ